jgi:cytochrome c oxidase subunit 2
VGLGFVHPGRTAQDTADDIALSTGSRAGGRALPLQLKPRRAAQLLVPVFRLKQDAIRAVITAGSGHEDRDHDIQCAEICGIGHGVMGARIVIESPAEHAAWMASRSSVSVASLASPSAVQE